MASRQLAGAALTAKLIKKRLTALYPGVKFSVRSDVFSMGDSVDIRWTDGPLRESIEVITKQYQNGSFNSMEDIYEYEAIDPALGCEGAKYVNCHHELSPKHRAMLEEKAVEHYGSLNPNDNSYYRKLADVEKMFFPYQEAEQKPSASITHDGKGLSGLEIKIIKDVDTRDDSELFVVKIITKVDDFKSLRSVMDSFGGYYSRFKKGFIFRDDPTATLMGDTADTMLEVNCA